MRHFVLSPAAWRMSVVGKLRRVTPSARLRAMGGVWWVRRTVTGERRQVAVAISGGVDSAVTALLMKREGHDVVGVHMQNWDLSSDETLHATAEANRETFACFEQDEKDARQVCEALQIPFHRVSFSEEYWTDVWTRVVKEYQEGFTPNPDILCNRFIKASVLPDFIEGALGLSTVATGHYAQRKVSFDDQGRPLYRLFSGVDLSKDQSYFLSQITQEQLSRLEFPLGEFTKKQVKSIAGEEASLRFLLEKRESMGVCFVGKRRSGFKVFLSQYIPPNPGLIRSKDGVLGQHQGLHTMTVGERARIGGHPEP
jgi:tRNA-5-taurinomethyluridine 2-sulfurtransferase